MQIRTKLAAVVVSGAAALTLAAAGPALASSHASASPVTGPEVIAGTIHGKPALANAPVIPLRLVGLVRTRSGVNLGGNGAKPGATKTLKTPAGKLTVMVTAKPTTTNNFNLRTCRFSFANDIQLSVVGSKSTGKFAGGSGPGAVQVQFSARGPKFKSGPKKGQCNPKGKPIARTAVASFLGSLVLTLP